MTPKCSKLVEDRIDPNFILLLFMLFIFSKKILYKIN